MNSNQAPDSLDAVNRRLLTELQANPRLTMSALARRVGMSSPTVTERVQRLEQAGVIRGYRLDIDPAALGLPVGCLGKGPARAGATGQDRQARDRATQCQ